MKITIDELFSSTEFENIVKEQWKKQYKETGKLQTRSKKSLIIELLKYYQSAEYVKGTKKTKASFELGDKLSIELSNAEMVEKGYRKANAGNTSNHNIIALNIFKNYLQTLRKECVKSLSMTRMQWLQQAGITKQIDLNTINQSKIENEFKKYYQNDIESAFKNVFSFCIRQLKINEADATLYYCDCAYDEDAEMDENGNKKRLISNDEVMGMKEYVKELKTKHGVTNFYFANAKFKKELKKWYKNNLKSGNIWIEIEINVDKLEFENVELDGEELKGLVAEFMSELQKNRNKLYVKREFKQKIKGKGIQWRHSAKILDLLEKRRSIIAPFAQMEERTYFKKMVELDEAIGFGKADFSEYNETDKQYKNDVTNDVKFMEEWRQATELSSKQYEEYDDMFNVAIAIA